MLWPHVDDNTFFLCVAGRTLLTVRVPRVTRRQRPIYVGQNPLLGTYRRNYEGDYHCTPEEVGRMLADQADEPADSHILPGFGLDDLDPASLQQFRQLFSARDPDHAWLLEDNASLLTKASCRNKWLKLVDGARSCSSSRRGIRGGAD